MTSASQIFPYCMNCFAIPAFGIWTDAYGKAAKTTLALKTCGRCRRVRYCNSACQVANWDVHKANCIAQKNLIDIRLIDEYVHSMCAPEPGNAVIHLNARKQVAAIKQQLFGSAENKIIHLTIKLENQKYGPYEYQICIRGFFNWREKFEACMKKGNSVEAPIVELGYEMIHHNLHAEAFKLISEKADCMQQYLFFSHAVKLMHDMGVDMNQILYCASFLNKNYFEVDVIVNPPDLNYPPEISKQITTAQCIENFHKKNEAMSSIASKLITIGLYDQAFHLIFEHVHLERCRNSFFQDACEIMISREVEHEKIVQLGRSISLSDLLIQHTVTGIDLKHGHVLSVMSKNTVS